MSYADLFNVNIHAHSSLTTVHVLSGLLVASVPGFQTRKGGTLRSSRRGGLGSRLACWWTCNQTRSLLAACWWHWQMPLQLSHFFFFFISLSFPPLTNTNNSLTHTVVTVPGWVRTRYSVPTSANGTVWTNVSAQVSGCKIFAIFSPLLPLEGYDCWLGEDECRFCCLQTVPETGNVTCMPLSRDHLRPYRSSCYGGFCEDVSDCFVVVMVMWHHVIPQGQCHPSTQDLIQRLFELFDNLSFNAFGELSFFTSLSL